MTMSERKKSKAKEGGKRRMSKWPENPRAGRQTRNEVPKLTNFIESKEKKNLLISKSLLNPTLLID